MNCSTAAATGLSRSHNDGVLYDQCQCDGEGAKASDVRSYRRRVNRRDQAFATLAVSGGRYVSCCVCEPLVTRY